MARIVVTGSGTGGHVTPLKAITTELRAQIPDASIHFIGQIGDPFRSLLDGHDAIDKKMLIFAGKWRRYPNETLVRRLLDIRTLAYNVRDLVYAGIGFLQVSFSFAVDRPGVVFSKAGPSAVPVGLAAALLRIPLITHDSDAIPGWAHRLIGRWAKIHAVGTASDYPYPKPATKFVGVPILDIYSKRPTKSAVNKAREELKVDKPLVFIMGGSLGAKAINDAVLAIADKLVKTHEIIHVTGQSNYDDINAEASNMGLNGYTVLPFISEPKLVYRHYLAATVVISRAGATNTAEIAAVGAASIIVPGEQLLDQQANSAALKKLKAAIVMQDSQITKNPGEMYDEIIRISSDLKLSQLLSDNAYELARPNAAKDLAALIAGEFQNNDESK